MVTAIALGNGLSCSLACNNTEPNRPLANPLFSPSPTSILVSTDQHRRLTPAKQNAQVPLHWNWEAVQVTWQQAYLAKVGGVTKHVNVEKFRYISTAPGVVFFAECRPNIGTLFLHNCSLICCSAGGPNLANQVSQTHRRRHPCCQPARLPAGSLLHCTTRSLGHTFSSTLWNSCSHLKISRHSVKVYLHIPSRKAPPWCLKTRAESKTNLMLISHAIYTLPVLG